jgi:hypothetical protein
MYIAFIIPPLGDPCPELPRGDADQVATEIVKFGACEGSLIEVYDSSLPHQEGLVGRIVDQLLVDGNSVAVRTRVGTWIQDATLNVDWAPALLLSQTPPKAA